LNYEIYNPSCFILYFIFLYIIFILFINKYNINNNEPRDNQKQTNLKKGKIKKVLYPPALERMVSKKVKTGIVIPVLTFFPSFFRTFFQKKHGTQKIKKYKIDYHVLW